MSRGSLFSSFNPRLWQPVLRIWALIYTALFFGYYVPLIIGRTDQERDLIIYYHTAQNVLAHKPLYVARPGYTPFDKPFDYLYPPPFAAAIAPLGHLDFLAFARLWTVLLLACWLIYAVVLVALAGKKFDFWNLALANSCIGLVYGGLRAFALGQIDPFLWMVCALAILALKKRPGVAGFLLSLLALIKIYGIWTWLVFVESPQRWRIWGSALGVAIIGFLLGGALCGFGSYLIWAKAVLPVVGQGTFNIDNFSLSMGVLRLARLCGWDYQQGPLMGLPKMWLSVAAIVGPLATLYWTRARNLSPEWRVALVSCVSALCAPLCWSSYLPLLLIPLALWLGQNKTPESQ